MAGPTPESSFARRRGYAIMANKVPWIEKDGKVEGPGYSYVSRGARLCCARQRDIEDGEEDGPTARATGFCRVGQGKKEGKK